MHYALAYVVTAVVFLVLDITWLTLMGQRLYREEIGQLLAKDVRLLPALAFYVLYISGALYFAVRPALASGRAMDALLPAAILGLVAYGTYDLTNQATMVVWSTKITFFDLLWGAVITGVSCTAAAWVTLKVFKNLQPS